MMGRGAFRLLKARRQRPESGKQVETRLTGLLTILCIAGCGLNGTLAKSGNHMQWLCRVGFPGDMANWPPIASFVIQITVLAEKMAQYPATRRKMWIR
jgi:hypothetical protein